MRGLAERKPRKSQRLVLGEIMATGVEFTGFRSLNPAAFSNNPPVLQSNAGTEEDFVLSNKSLAGTESLVPRENSSTPTGQFVKQNSADIIGEQSAQSKIRDELIKAVTGIRVGQNQDFLKLQEMAARQKEAVEAASREREAEEAGLVEKEASEAERESGLSDLYAAKPEAAARVYKDHQIAVRSAENNGLLERLSLPEPAPPVPVKKQPTSQRFTVADAQFKQNQSSLPVFAADSESQVNVES